MTGALGPAIALAAWVLTMVLAAITLAHSPAADALGALQGALIPTIAMSYTSFGLLLRSKAGARRIGWLLPGGGLAFRAMAFGFVAGGSAATGAAPGAGVLVALGQAAAWPALVGMLPALALLFPDGRLPGRRWRTGAILASVPAVGIVPWIAGQPPVLLSISIVAWACLGTAGAVARYRHGSDIQRRQLRWFIAAVVLAAALLAAGFATASLLFGSLWLASMTLIPAAVWVAITRYRLYDIDRLISRTVSWALVTAVLVAVFGGVVVALQAALAGVTQGQTLAVAVSTLVAFALFQPVRRRVQHGVDRRFDRARYDGELTAQAFAARLRDQVDLRGLEADIADTVRSALRPGSVELWFRGEAEQRERVR